MSSDLNLISAPWALAVHELRTPLGVATGYLRLLQREGGDSLTDTQRKMLEEASRACGRIGAIIVEMSELEQLETKNVTIPSVPFNLAELIVELAGSMLDGQDRGVSLEVHATQPVIVMGDRARLAAVIRALMYSALRERDEPGVIIAGCSTRPDATRAWALVTIGDETTTRSLIEAACEPPPYFDEWRGGLGLALPVGRRLIEAYGGSLWSAPAGAPRAGSAFRLPVAQ